MDQYGIDHFIRVGVIVAVIFAVIVIGIVGIVFSLTGKMDNIVDGVTAVLIHLAALR